MDYVELIPSSPFPKPRQIPARLADPKAGGEARDLYRKLLAGYGKVSLSGQYDEADNLFVEKTTGKVPAIMGADFMDYSPSRLPYMDKPYPDPLPSWLRSAKSGQLLTLSWHWNAPMHVLDGKVTNADGKVEEKHWYSGFYTAHTTFDLAKALADRSSPEYVALVRDIDAIAVQLKRLSDAKVPVLWRPLHEAEGGWFWWGAKGAEPCKALWRLLFNRLTQHHGLHNLIWVWNSADPAWYPGDDTVDVVSIDSYPSDRRDPLSENWEKLIAQFDGKKPLAVAEFPGAMDVERMFRFGARWLYWVSWTGDLGPKKTDPDLLKRTFESKLSVHRGQGVRLR